MTAVNTRSGPTVPAPAATDGSVTVLYVDDDPDYLDLAATLLREESAFEVHTETTPGAALERVDEVDCLVTDYNMPDRNGLELLAEVRERYPTLPVVVCTGSALSEVIEGVVDDDWAEVVSKDGSDVTTALLVHRIERLVATRRAAARAQRALAALDEAADGLAVVTDDGRFATVNRAFARAFDADRAALVGTDWREWFPDDEVERLRSTALEPVRDDWRWTGSCVGRPADGGTFTSEARIVGLDDGSFVLALAEPDATPDE